MRELFRERSALPTASSPSGRYARSPRACSHTNAPRQAPCTLNHYHLCASETHLRVVREFPRSPMCCVGIMADMSAGSTSANMNKRQTTRLRAPTVPRRLLTVGSYLLSLMGFARNSLVIRCVDSALRGKPFYNGCDVC